MSNPTDPSSHDAPPPPGPEEILRVLLGQADEEESRRVRALLADDAGSARTAGILGEIRGVMAELAREASDAPPSSLFEQAKALSNLLPRPPSWLDRMSAMVLQRIDDASAGLAAGLAPMPALRGGHGSNLASFAAEGVRLDAESSRAADGSHLLRMQLDAAEDGSLAAEFVVLDRSSGCVVAQGMLDSDGAARVSIAADSVPARTVEIAIHRDGRTLVAAEVPVG